MTPVTKSDATKEMALSSGCFTFLLASSIAASVSLLQYMALDYYVVRIRPYPVDVHRYDWVILLFPIAPAFAIAALSIKRALCLDFGLGIASWFCGLVFAVPLIATAGMWFHFAIGGKL